MLLLGRLAEAAYRSRAAVGVQIENGRFAGCNSLWLPRSLHAVKSTHPQGKSPAIANHSGESRLRALLIVEVPGSSPGPTCWCALVIASAVQTYEAPAIITCEGFNLYRGLVPRRRQPCRVLCPGRPIRPGPPVPAPRNRMASPWACSRVTMRAGAAGVDDFPALKIASEGSV